MDHIHNLEDTAKEKSSARAEKSSSRVKERAGRTKRVAVQIPSGRPASNTPPSPDSPNSEEEILFKRGKGQALQRRLQPPLVSIMSNLHQQKLHLPR